jgi:hypothetical protein
VVGGGRRRHEERLRGGRPRPFPPTHPPALPRARDPPSARAGLARRPYPASRPALSLPAPPPDGAPTGRHGRHVERLQAPSGVTRRGPLVPACHVHGGLHPRLHPPPARRLPPAVASGTGQGDGAGSGDCHEQPPILTASPTATLSRAALRQACRPGPSRPCCPRLCMLAGDRRPGFRSGGAAAAAPLAAPRGWPAAMEGGRLRT